MRWTALLLLGCGPAAPEAVVDDCATEPPAQGEVRAKKITCAEELAERGEGRIGDWLLESADLKLVIRNTPNRMTQLGGAGGTIIDAAVPGRVDALTEIVPELSDAWPESLTIGAEDGEIILTATDGTDRVVSYGLDAETGTLRIEGSVGATWVPVAGATVRGDWINASGLVATSDVPMEDRGGWVHWSDTDTIVLGTPSVVSSAQTGGDASVATGSSDGDWIEVGGPDGVIFRARTIEGAFSLSVPSGQLVRTTKWGHESSPWTTPSQDMVLEIGEDGFLALLVLDENGDPIPATLTWNGRNFSAADDGAPIGVGPGTGSGTVTAGPEYGQAEIAELDISGTVEHSVTLERVRSPAAWTAFSIPGFPDESERRSVSSLMRTLAAQGIDYAVLNATDEVSQASGGADIAHLISVSSGSRSGGPLGGILAWPWTADSDLAAHGAVDWRGQDAADLHALMSKSGLRNTAVTVDWVMAAGQANLWDPEPYALMLSGPGDVSILTELWDVWVSIVPISEYAWIHVDGRSKTEILRGLLEGRATASTGPQVHLTVDGESPGTAFDEQAERVVTIDIEGPGDISTLTMIGASGESQGPWSVDDLPVETSVSHGGWIAVVAEGSTDWAVTSPVWLSRP